MSLSDYLAKNYTSSREKPAKFKKEKSKNSKESTTSILIDDLTAPLSSRSKSSNEVDGTEDAPEHITIEPVPKRPKKSSGWKIVGTNQVLTAPVIDSEQPRMASGAKAGLQTSEQVAAQIREKHEREIRYLNSQANDPSSLNQETVHRDSIGRKIDINANLNEKRTLKELEEQRRKQRLIELNMGLVQKLELESKRQKLEDAKTSGFTTYANDSKLNEELQKKELDDDPLLSFKPSKSQKYVSLTGRKLYKGGFPENRFGIKPGYRWDGVDRSNGFEKLWFDKQVELERRKTLSYTMQDEY